MTERSRREFRSCEYKIYQNLNHKNFAEMGSKEYRKAIYSLVHRKGLLIRYKMLVNGTAYYLFIIITFVM